MKYAVQLGLSLGLFLMSFDTLARTPEAIKQSGELIVASRDNLPPMSFMKNQQRVGIDIDLANRLANALGVKVKWYAFTNLSERENLLTSQTVDVVISSYSITEERLAVVSFSDSYLDSGSVLLIRQAQANTIKSYKDLVNHRVAVVNNSVSKTTLASIFTDKISLISVDKIDDAYSLLANQKVDAVVYDKAMLDYYAATHENVKVVKEDPIDPNQYAIGLNQTDKELLSYINSWLKDLKHSGKLNEILKAYETASLNLDKTTISGNTKNYRIKAGDTLSSIAREVYADASQWVIIYKANRDVIKYPNIIPTGRTLKIPNRTKAVEPTKTDCNGKLKSLNAYKKDLDPAVFRQKQKDILDECI